MHVVGAVRPPRKSKNGLTGDARRVASSTSRHKQRADHKTGAKGEQQRGQRQPVVVALGGGSQEGALRVRRQQEDEPGVRGLHDNLAEEGRSPGLAHVHWCCRLQPKRLSPDPPIQGETVCVLLKSDRVVLLDFGENVQGEPGCL